MSDPVRRSIAELKGCLNHLGAVTLGILLIALLLIGIRKEVWWQLFVIESLFTLLP